MSWLGTLGSAALLLGACTSEDDTASSQGGTGGSGGSQPTGGSQPAGGSQPIGGGQPAGGGQPEGGSSPIDNPYAGYPTWCKVTVHTHPAKTSGTALAAAYSALDYDLIFFTDHDYDPQTDPVTVPGMVVVRGEEVSTDAGHCNALGTTAYIDPDMSRQETIDAAAAQGALLQVNHPSRYGVTPAELDALTGLWGLEIKNESQNSPDDIVLWDSQLAQRKRLMGTFSDDAHDDGDVGRGWLMVNTPDECSATSVMANMANGNFYDTEGPSLAITVSGNTISVTSDTATTIEWYREGVTLLQSTDAATDSYTITGSEIFVRIVAFDSDDNVAMSMPLFTNE
ncbi:MAG: CehA/McbA family metallohydrolase [Deltaproteobacteria bacterium]|nr:CehA/McbA family metallohydrolase [Deltaproteobacteria bacterium]MBW2535172.1 CehA/McbA family metallohydrolase [Deltaproteobacteria bacterium]